MNIYSLAVGLIIFKLSLVYISIRVNEPSPPISFIVLPIPFIESKIFPDLLATSIPHSIFELTNIGGTIL